VADEGDRERKDQTPTLWQSWVSVLSGFFGVQSSAKRKRDFTHGKASHFILLGLLATGLLISLLVGVVKLVTSLAG
jgi:Mg/Co/Ni transporter MgtE